MPVSTTYVTRPDSVAGGHLTPPDPHSVYSGVVSLRSMRIALLIGELNNLSCMAGDIGNAYLEAYTNEKVYFIAGPEFGDLEGRVLIIRKALYGLRSSGARFHEKLADTLQQMGFKPCYADPDLWYRDAGDHYEYLCVYVDDLLAIMKNPQEFYDTLINDYGYKLKGVGPPDYHLGGNFERNADGMLTWGAKRYVEKMIDTYEKMFGELPHLAQTPLKNNDSPELDTSNFLDKDGISRYQSMIGALQWAITLGRFDISVAVTALSRFRSEPRQGHLDRLKRIYGYLRKHKSGRIVFRTEIPNHEALYEVEEHDWLNSIYGQPEEEIPEWMPTPKGKAVRLTTYKDANPASLQGYWQGVYRRAAPPEPDPDRVVLEKARYS